MFTITQPSERGLRELLDKWKDAPFSYRDVGATRDGPVPTGYNIDRYRVKLGSGSEIFDAAKRAVQAWAMFDLEWVSIFPSTAVIQPGAVVAVVVAHFGFWSANLARVVYVDPQDAMFRFAYGTLGEHAESGEERFTVSTDQNGDVWYDVFAFSRQSHALARASYPLSRMLQKRFARDSMAAVQRRAAAT